MERSLGKRLFDIVGTSPLSICSPLQTAGNRLVLSLSSLLLGFMVTVLCFSLHKVTQKYSSVDEEKKRNGCSKTHENRGGRN